MNILQEGIRPAQGKFHTGGQCALVRLQEQLDKRVIEISDEQDDNLDLLVCTIWYLKQMENIFPMNNEKIDRTKVIGLQHVHYLIGRDR